MVKIPKKPILIKIVTSKGCKAPKAQFKCECGNLFVTQIGSVNNGHTKSCGCYNTKVRKYIHLTHKHSNSAKNNKPTPTYCSWHNMIQRCDNVKSLYYKNYGGRGIKVCKRWYKFENFLDDMGKRPENTTIERINNNKNYYKANCKWANNIEQARNKNNTSKVKYRGKIISLLEAHEKSKSKVNIDTVRRRLYRGWELERALFTVSLIKRS